MINYQFITPVQLSTADAIMRVHLRQLTLSIHFAFSALTLLGFRKSIGTVIIEWWGVGMITCMEWGASCLHTVQLMPLRMGMGRSFSLDPQSWRVEVKSSCGHGSEWQTEICYWHFSKQIMPSAHWHEMKWINVSCNIYFISHVTMSTHLKKIK